MRMGWWLVVFLLLEVSCFSTAQYDAANAQRIAAINQRHDEELRKLDARYLELIEAADELKKYLIPVTPGGSYAPVVRVAQQPEVLACDARCKSDSASLPSDVAQEFLRRCSETVCRDVYASALRATYFEADFSWAAAQLHQIEGSDGEALLTYSHNQKILSEIEKLNQGTREARDAARRSIEESRGTEIAGSWQQHSDEVALGRAQHRARWAAIGQALSQMGNRTSGASSATPYSTVASTGCTSDFSCGMGFRCVKEHYALSGSCMKEVNQYGNPTYGAPRLESIGPNVSTGCKLLTDCPIGFTCDAKTGACLR